VKNQLLPPPTRSNSTLTILARSSFGLYKKTPTLPINLVQLLLPPMLSVNNGSITLMPLIAPTPPQVIGPVPMYLSLVFKVIIKLAPCPVLPLVVPTMSSSPFHSKTEPTPSPSANSNSMAMIVSPNVTANTSTLYNLINITKTSPAKVSTYTPSASNPKNINLPELAISLVLITQLLPLTSLLLQLQAVLLSRFACMPSTTTSFVS